MMRWILVLATALMLAPALAAAQQPRMPREPAVPKPQTLTIEGWWGYPCLVPHQGCPSFNDEWRIVEVVAWRGQQKFPGHFTSPVYAFRFDFEVAIQVAPGQGGDLVMLEVTAQSPDGHKARFTQVVDVAHRLQAEATPEGRVLRTDARPRMLTIFTTALTGLLEEANGGDWRMDEARLHELLPQIDPARVMKHALAFQALVSGRLPGAGSVDPNALVASSAAVDAYLADVSEPELRSIYDAIQYEGRTAFQPIDFEGINLALVPAAAPGTVAFGRREGVRIHRRDPWDEEWNGTTIMDTGLARRGASYILFYTDSLWHTARLVRPRYPSYESQRFNYDCPGAGEVQAIRITERSPSRFRRMAMVGAIEFVEYTEQRSLSYLPLAGDEVPCLASLPTSDGNGKSYRLAYPLRGRGRMFVPPFVGPVALQLLNPDPDPLQEDTQFVAGMLDLATGAVDAPGYADSGLVHRDADGRVLLVVEALPGTLREGLVQMRLEGVRGDGVGALEWMVSSRVTGSTLDHMRAHVTPVVALDAGFVLDAGLLEGTWGSGSDLSRPATTEAMTMSFNAVAGLGTHEVPGGASVPFSWLLEDGHMQASTFVLDTQPEALLPACPTETAGCREVLRRVWEPLRMGLQGELQRLYVIEEVWHDTGSGLQRVSRQLNFYDAY